MFEFLNQSKMKTLGLILLICVPLMPMAAQEPTGAGKDTTNKTLSKADLKKIELEKDYDSTLQLLADRNFVLEANFLSNLYGRRIYVNSNLNFIRVDSSYAVIQIGSNNGIGFNGVGGVTAEGNITRWKLITNEKNKTFYLSISVMTSIGIYDIDMNINADGSAVANLTGLQHGRLTYEGELVPGQESRVYKGSTTY